MGDEISPTVPPSERLEIGASLGRAGSPATVLVALIGAMRPKQWLKNVLVFVAPAAAGTLSEGPVLAKALIAFAAFCLVASGLYMINDVRDVDADRNHPRKSRRPLAAGTLPIPIAITAAVLFVGGGLVLGGLAGTWELAVSLIVYVAITMAYTLRLKTEPVIELACVASGFVLRATGGGVATDTQLSVWFVVVISFGALFLVTGKRLAEMPTDANPGERRVVLTRYTTGFLKSTLTLSATIAIAAYCQWAFESNGIVSRSDVSPIWIQLTVVPVVLGALHVLLRLDRGEGSAPEDLAFSDRLLQIIGVIWAALILVGIYG